MWSLGRQRFGEAEIAIATRANRKEMILDSAAMKDLFRETVVRVKRKYDARPNQRDYSVWADSGISRGR
jgi:hypothetical protein